MAFLYPNEPINESLITAARIVPHQVARVKLSKTQLRILNAIKNGEKTTAIQIAYRCDLSSSFASTLLKELVKRCHLTRRSSVRKFGGVEFEYYRLDGSSSTEAEIKEVSID
ncbi:helix-turn-helix domain-containing protein [Vibrio sp. YMD68]|nr:helix-turn-helix domain-containing protein [Vibrio sp. YMD68]WGW01891.1 helix-turn-helix domain-containing protein [Vibrio sp. YMD68]